MAPVTDRYGHPVAGQTVRISVEGDGQMSTIGNGQEVVEGLTDGNGEFKAVFTAGHMPGVFATRAELIVEGSELSLFLPIVRAD